MGMDNRRTRLVRLATNLASVYLAMQAGKACNKLLIWSIDKIDFIMSGTPFTHWHLNDAIIKLGRAKEALEKLEASKELGTKRRELVQAEIQVLTESLRNLKLIEEKN